MSKILRRPMFRGGGKVNSYGKGIAAPLVPGYEGGGQIGGGIIYGKPMADGRYGFQKPVLYNAADIVAQNSLIKSPGMEFLEREALKKRGQVPMIPIDVPGVRKLPSENLIDEKSETKATGYSTGVGESEMGIADEFSGIDGGIEFLSNEEQYEKNVENVLKKVEEGKRLNPNEEKIRIEEGILTYEDINRKGKTQKTIEEIIEEKKVPDKLPDTTLLEVLDDEDNEESIDIDPKKAIAENQALFAELLGVDKARGQDIGDMLLRFSGSQGNTVGEKFQNYTRAESAAGPSRSEKIKQTAAGLAINDYVAGKRSKEQADIYKGKIDYKIEKEGNQLSIGPNDDLAIAKAKAAKSTGKSITSDQVIATLIQGKTGKTTVPIQRIDIDLDEVKRKKDKLKKGYNIVNGSSGESIIVLYDGVGEPNVIGTIDQMWGMN